MNIKNALVVYTTPRAKEEKSTLDTVRNMLKKHKIRFGMANRDRLKKLQLKNKDLIVAVGGDGTFLRAAHFIGSQKLMGVNSDIKNKEGFFMKSNKKDFEAKLKKVIEGTSKIKKLPRLEASINGRESGTLALNEFFIGSKKSYQAAKYTIQVGSKKEMQKSSGILITTPSGSRAWAKSCYGKTLPLNSGNYQFLVREPYEGQVFKDYALKHGILGKSQKIKIKSEMLDGILIADSVGKEHSFKNGSKATIKLSGKHLNAIWK